MSPVYSHVSLRFLLLIYCQYHNIEIFLSGMEVRSFLIGGIFWIDADSLPVSVCGSAGWGHSDGEGCFQSFAENWFNNVGITCFCCVNICCFKGFKFQRLVPL